jgi:hypothetical protein
MAIHHRGSLDPGHVSPASFDAPVVVREEAGFVLAKWKNVGIVVWGVQATLPLVAKLEVFSDALIAEHQEGISAVHVIANAAALPESATRAELDRISNKYAKNLACMATVIEGTGFWASAMHSFITSIHWVTRRPFKVRISSNLNEIAAWLPTLHWERTGVRFSTADILRVLQSIRDRVH